MGRKKTAPNRPLRRSKPSPSSHPKPAYLAKNITIYRRGTPPYFNPWHFYALNEFLLPACTSLGFEGEITSTKQAAGGGGGVAGGLPLPLVARRTNEGLPRSPLHVEPPLPRLSEPPSSGGSLSDAAAGQRPAIRGFPSKPNTVLR